MTQGLSTSLSRSLPYCGLLSPSLMVSRYTTLVLSMGLRIGPACEAGLSAGMRRERVPPQRKKGEPEVRETKPNGP